MANPPVTITDDVQGFWAARVSERIAETLSVAGI